MKVAIGTLGCKLNHFESEAIQEDFEKNDFEMVNFNKKADVYVINTCTVTGKSDYRSRQLIRRAINNNKDAFIVVTGCYVQLKNDEIAQIKGVDLILGNEEKFEIIKYLNGLKRLDRPKIIVGDINKKRDFSSLYIKRFRGYTKAFIKIQTGCDFSCAYCSIWQARGPNRSEKPDLVVKQIEELTKAGYQEIVLTGVCLGNYGNDLGEGVNLANLLEEIEKIDGLKRLRLSSIEPVEVSDKLIDIMAHSSKICHHLHIPLQSGDDHILRLMNRKYDSKLYRRLINNLRKKIPDIGIGADVMVGFPGETEERFQNTKRFIEELSVTYLHVFNFSKREGTVAFNMEGQVLADIRKKRSKILRDLGRMKPLEFKKSFLGKGLDVLIENTRDKDNHLLKGFTGNYIKIFLDGPDTLMGKIISVKLKEIKDGNVYGEI
ncbi:MAG TPA: tRNA (N(6)-L-threonylcarbamoyladenosine(37)-C(2))-methylthiotransferase MtaB [Nitrospinota bacterium]|nr:tRNA (N(6)-L-threonylcarbamoyladenosine(37)-C(2))-methylthiotransferase MtaB [Nitrospinota bacterium]